MKKYYLTKLSVAALICLCVGLLACAFNSTAAAASKPAPASADEATLTVARTASVGSGVFVNLSVDGKRVANLSKGRNYRGTLTPGKHTISIAPDPNTTGQRPSNVEVNAEKGHTYAFSAGHGKSGELVLVAK